MGNTLKAAEYAIRLWGLKTATGILTRPIFAIGITLIYFNQCIRREGSDSEMAAL